MSVSLEELYNGTVRKLALQKVVICEKCEGRGGEKGPIEKCPNCHGKGMETKVQTISPILTYEINQICSHCNGQSQICLLKELCTKCNGKKTLLVRDTFEVHVQKGMYDGQEIVLSGEGNQEPNKERGDVVILLKERKHAIFQRSSNKHDLVMRIQLGMTEAFCGLQKVIKTLDNRDLTITNWPGYVIKQDSYKCIQGEGMPHYEKPFQKGRLILQFQIVFPDKIPQQLVVQIKKYIPVRSMTSIPMEYNIV